MAAARIKRDEFVKRVTESRSKEYLSPANENELAKSHSHVDLGPSPQSTTSITATSEDVIELSVPSPPLLDNQLLSPTASIKSRPDVLTSSFKESNSGVKRNQHRNLLKQAYQSLLSAILDPIAYLREKHNFEPKVCQIRTFSHSNFYKRI